MVCKRAGTLKKYFASDWTDYLSYTVYLRLTSTNQINCRRAPAAVGKSNSYWPMLTVKTCLLYEGDLSQEQEWPNSGNNISAVFFSFFGQIGRGISSLYSRPRHYATRGPNPALWPSLSGHGLWQSDTPLAEHFSITAWYLLSIEEENFSHRKGHAQKILLLFRSTYTWTDTLSSEVQRT